MEIFNYLISFFGIDMLTEDATLIDAANVGFKVFVSVFLVCFILRSLFLLLKFGDR